jgi:hypothetical protein
MALETGIFLSQAIWLWRVRHIRKVAKKGGKTYDEYVAENPSEKLLRSKWSAATVDVEGGQVASRETSATAEKPAYLKHSTNSDHMISKTTPVSTEIRSLNAKMEVPATAIDIPTTPTITYPENVAIPMKSDLVPDVKQQHL